MVGRLSIIDVSRVTLQTTRSDLTGVRGVAVDEAGTVDPVINFVQIGDVHLVQTVAMPIQITLRDL